MILCAGNLSLETTEKDIRDLFTQKGKVDLVELQLNPDDGNSRGYAFVHMEDRHEGKRAMLELTGANLDGRTINVTLESD